MRWPCSSCRPAQSVPKGNPRKSTRSSRERKLRKRICATSGSRRRGTRLPQETAPPGDFSISESSAIRSHRFAGSLPSRGPAGILRASKSRWKGIEGSGKRSGEVATMVASGRLAVALALQDTLSNLFGGFYVAVAGQVRLGDYVKLSSGEEGYVSDIGWRCT